MFQIVTKQLFECTLRQYSKTWKYECIPACREAHPHANCNSVRCLMRSDVRGDQHMLRSWQSLSTRHHAVAWCCCGNKDKSSLTRAGLSCQEEALTDGCDYLDWIYTTRCQHQQATSACLLAKIFPRRFIFFGKTCTQSLFFWLSNVFRGCNYSMKDDVSWTHVRRTNRHALKRTDTFFLSVICIWKWF